MCMHTFTSDHKYIYPNLLGRVRSALTSLTSDLSALWCVCLQLVIRVHLSDESSKTMMVDERQTVRQVLDSLLEIGRASCRERV